MKICNFLKMDLQVLTFPKRSLIVFNKEQIYVYQSACMFNIECNIFLNK